MPDSELTKLRGARSRCHVALHQAELQVEAYAFKLSQIEARIQAIAPELELPPRHRRSNPHFARGELPCLMLAILREAGEPQPIAAIAVRALRAKGVVWPDPTLRRRTRTRLRETFGKMRARGLLVTVGRGNAT